MDKDTYFNMIDVKLMSFFSVVLAESGIKKNVHGDRVAGIGTMCALVTSFVYLPSISWNCQRHGLHTIELKRNYRVSFMMSIPKKAARQSSQQTIATTQNMN